MILFYAALSALLIFPSILSAGAKKPPAPARSDFYIGEGWAELGPDAGVAREQAKIRALGDLARNVRVSVRSVLIDVLGQNAGRPQQSLESKINTYAEIPPTRLDREEFILNEPQRGQLTCRVAVNRARYDGDVRRDVLNKKNFAIEEARRAHAALRNGQLAEALRALASLQSRAAIDFPNLPLDGDADSDGKTEDVLLWGRDRQGDIQRSLKLTCTPGPFIFDENGRFNGTPTAHVSWSGPPPVHLDGIPLRARWTHRPDHVVAQSLSDKGGTASLRPLVDLFVGSSFLQIEMENDGGTCRSEFHKRRQAVVTVRADREDVRKKIAEEVLLQLKRFPWDVRTAQESETSNGLEAEIVLSVHTTVVRHPDGDIHRATISLQAEINPGISGKAGFRGKGPTAVGFGVTPEDAVRNALDHFLPQLGPWLTQQVKELP